jgi:peroxiredoxin Q/BCP
MTRFYQFSAVILAAVVAGLAGVSGAAESTPQAAVEVGKPAPAFRLPDQNDQPVSLTEQRGKWVVLYFYPKDDTPGCTAEACEFTDSLKNFESLNAVVFGCSPDSPESHRKFIEKHDLKITLLSDEKRQVMSTYGAFDGRRVIRATVIIDPDGQIAHHWPTVKPRGHAAEVKAKLTELRK